MSDYYEPHPRLVLERPVLLAGQVGSGVSAMARHVCGRTGLSLTEVDRFLEHREGRSLARLATEWGADRLAEETADALDSLVAKRPAGLLVLGNAWPALSKKRRAQLMETVHGVYIARPEAFLRARVQREVARVGDWIVQGWDGWPNTDAETEEARRFFSIRKPLLLAAQSLVEAGEQHENEVAEVLLASLESVFQADPV